LNEIEQKSADQHDKAVLQLAMAALGVSITFLDKIAPQPIRCTLILLFAGWVSLILSIVAIVGSFLMSQRACQYEREMLDKEFREQTQLDRDKKHSKRVTRLNRLAYIGFVVGVGLILIFSGWNLWNVEGKKMQENSKPIVAQDVSTRGTVPASPPAQPTQQTSTRPAPEPSTKQK
jgi:hypothetical protein